MADLKLEDIGTPVIHAVEGLDTVGLEAPVNRHGQSIRAWVRSLHTVVGIPLGSAKVRLQSHVVGVEVGYTLLR